MPSRLARLLVTLPLLAALLPACTGRMIGRVPAPADFILDRRLDRAERLLEVGELDDAGRLYEQLAYDYEPHRHTRWAELRIAEIALLEGDTRKAESLLDDILDSPAAGDDPAFDRAELLYGKLLYEKGKWREARTVLESYLASNPKSPEAPELLLTIGRIHERRDETRFALRAYDRGLDIATDPEDVGRMRDRVHVIIDGLGAKDLEDLATLYRGRYTGMRAEVALANLARRAGESDAAARRLDGAIPLYGDRSLFIETLRGTGPADARTVGCLLPLTGPYAPYGQLALAGIMSAAEVFTQGNPEAGLNWVIRDTGGDPTRVAGLIDELVEVHQVIGVVGPMVGEVVEQAAMRANQVGVPLITLTRKTPLEGLGEFVFRSSLTDRTVTESLVRISHEETDIQTYAVLYPDDAYGIDMRDLFIQSVRDAGGEVVVVSKYEPGAADFGDAIRALIHARPGEVAREGEELRLSFEALFLPGSADALELLAPQIAYYNLTAVQLLGTSAFNSQPLVQAAGEFLQGAIFVDGFLPTSQAPRTRAFVDRYFLDFQQNPGLVEALSFEAAKLLTDLLDGQELHTRLDLARALLTLDGYEGIVGLTGFEPSGEGRRKLKMLTVADRQIVELGWPATEWDERAATSATPEALPSFESVPLTH